MVVVVVVVVLVVEEEDDEEEMALFLTSSISPLVGAFHYANDDDGYYFCYYHHHHHHHYYYYRWHGKSPVSPPGQPLGQTIANQISRIALHSCVSTMASSFPTTPTTCCCHIFEIGNPRTMTI